MISDDGKTLEHSRPPKAIGNCDLYISRRTGNNWSTPLNLGLNVNSTEWDSQPSLSTTRPRTRSPASTRRGGQRPGGYLHERLQEADGPGPP
jgi:hypothetical protein